MLIAHLPAGYLVGVGLKNRWPAAPAVICAAIAGNLVPDIETIYVLYSDGWCRHSHDLRSHWPLLWLAIAAVSLPVVGVLKRSWLPAAAAFFLSALVHLALDTIASPVHWLAPFSGRTLKLAKVIVEPCGWFAGYSLHWTFLFEIAIFVAAATVWFRRRADQLRASAISSS